MHEVTSQDFARIAQDLQIRKVQVESVVKLLDEGNTVPFITRYRKERTGGLNEDVIRHVQGRVNQIRHLAERKQTILKSIEGQGKLTEELKAAILAADSPKRLEDIYLPFKPKKRTLATIAREKGLEPLAQAVWNKDSAVANLQEVLLTLVNPEKELGTPGDVQTGIQHILAEQIAETADVRAAARSVLWETGKLCTVKNESLTEGQGLDFKDYFQFAEQVRQIPPHRILAINRGEKENALKVRLEWNADAVRSVTLEKLPLLDHPHAEFLKAVAEDALARLLLPSLEREVRRELTERAEGHAVQIFARNLRSLLLQPPLHGKRVLALDPGFRTGCKVAALDETGNLLEDSVIFPHPPQNKKDDAKGKLEDLIRKHRLNVIAIGNGTACRETEELVSELIAYLAGGPAAEPPLAETASPSASTSAQTSVNRETAPPEQKPSSETPSPAEAAVASVPPTALTPDSGLQENAPSAAVGAESTATPAESPAPSQPTPETAAEALPAHEPAALESAVAPVVAEHGSDKASSSTPKAGADVPEQQSTAAPEAAVSTVASPAISSPQAPSAPPVRRVRGEPLEIAYVIVNEAGASVYSASVVGREEFPSYDATLRGTISIGRRLQDPLSELVKIDPQSIGVGLYQHDVNPRYLKESLDAVIESSVNHVGVDLNTASVPLLRHVSGLNQLVARELVDYRKQHGPFKNRQQLMEVPNMGPVRFVQAAGFLKIAGGDNPLDRTWIHPESYAAAQRLLTELGCGPEVLETREKTDELREKLKTLAPEEISKRLEVGEPTLYDILDALARPGRDPREDLPKPIFKKGILKLEDLQPGMELKGTVLNVVDFGAFVDIGLKDSGLVHISQMANRYIKSPYDVVAVSDVVTVWVLTVDKERRRVSLTMIQPGTEKRPEKQAQSRARRGQENTEGEAGGGGRRRGRRHPPGRGRAPAPGQGQLPAPAGTPQEGAAASQSPAPSRPGQPAPPPRPPLPPRKPQRQPPRPKLTQAALEGDSPLRTFSELKAFFEAKKSDDEPPAKP